MRCVGSGTRSGGLQASIWICSTARSHQLPTPWRPKGLRYATQPRIRNTANREIGAPRNINARTAITHSQTRDLRFWCHPERGRPTLANGSEGSAFRVGWTVRFRGNATADPSSRTPRDDTKCNSPTLDPITHSQTRVQSIRIYAPRRLRAEAHAHLPLLLRGSAIGSTPAFGAGYPGSSPGPGATSFGHDSTTDAQRRSRSGRRQAPPLQEHSETTGERGVPRRCAPLLGTRILLGCLFQMQTTVWHRPAWGAPARGR
jgi:hypothetical protein